MFLLGVKVERLVHEELRAVEATEDRVEGSSVPGVGHSATIVTLARQVPERLKLDLLVTDRHGR